MTSQLSDVTRRRVTGIAAFQLAGRIICAALGVAVTAILARSLEKDQFAAFSLALALAAMALSVTDLGATQVAMRQMVRFPADRAAIIGALVAVMLGVGSLLLVVGVGVSYLLFDSAEFRVVAIVILFTVPLGATNAFATAAQARLRSERFTVIMVVQSVIWASSVAILASEKVALTWFAVAYLVSVVAQAALTWFASRSVVPVAFRATSARALDLLTASWLIGLAGVIIASYYRIDGVLVYSYDTASSAADYAAAFKVFDVFQLIPSTLGAFVVPVLAAAAQSLIPGRATRAFRLIIAATGVVCIPIAVGGGLFAPAIISVLYGEDYEGASRLLALLLPAFVSTSVGWVVASAFITSGLTRAYFAAALLGLVINLTINLIWIPEYGAQVAAIATVLTEFSVCGFLILWLARNTEYRLPWGRLARATLATVPAAAVAILIGTDNWLAAGPPAAVTYIVAAYYLRPLTALELRGLISRDLATQA